MRTNPEFNGFTVTVTVPLIARYRSPNAIAVCLDPGSTAKDCSCPAVPPSFSLLTPEASKVSEEGANIQRAEQRMQPYRTSRSSTWWSETHEPSFALATHGKIMMVEGAWDKASKTNDKPQQQSRAYVRRRRTGCEGLCPKTGWLSSLVAAKKGGEQLWGTQSSLRNYLCDRRKAGARRHLVGGPVNYISAEVLRAHDPLGSMPSQFFTRSCDGYKH